MHDEASPFRGANAFATVTTEEKLLHSYDRFYKVVSKTTMRDTEGETPLPSLECFLRDVPSLPENHLASLRDVWARAERFSEVQRVVDNFHQYRSDLVRKAMRQNKALESQQSSVEMEDGLKEVLRSQCRMEQQLQFHSALLVGIEQHRDHFPGVVMQLIEQSGEAKHRQEKSALHDLLNQSQKQIDRLEQMTTSLEAKLLKWTGRETEWKFPSGAWPETLHNNIVYSSSFEGSNSSGSAGPGDEMHAKDNDVTDSERSGIAAAEAKEQNPGETWSHKKQEDSDQLSQEDNSTKRSPRLEGGKLNDATVKQERSMIAIMADCGASGDDSEPLSGSSPPLKLCINQEDQQQLQAAMSSINYQANKTASHLVPQCNKCEITGERQEERQMIIVKRRSMHLSEDFKEDFLQDVLRVQQNIESSTLGSNSSEAAAAAAMQSASSSETAVLCDPRQGHQSLAEWSVHDGSLLGVDVVSLLSVSFSEVCENGSGRCLGVQ